MVNSHGDGFRPLNRLVGSLEIHGPFFGINGGDPNYLYTNWDGPPSRSN